MKASVVNLHRSFSLKEIEKPALPEAGALVRVTGCGLCGSDVDKLKYREPSPGTVLGHEIVGVIEALSPTAKTNFIVGQRVVVAHHVPCGTCHYCRHGSPSMCDQFKQSNIVPGGFSEYIAISEAHLAQTVFALPDTLCDQAAICVEPLACCLRAIDRLPINIGTEALVVGLGFVGMMTAQVLQQKGFRVFGLDINPKRVAMAQQHGFVQDAMTAPDQAASWLQSFTDGRGVDVVFLSVVTPTTLQTALSAVRNGGTLLLFASDGTHESQLDPNPLYFREISIVSSYSPSVAHLKSAYQMLVAGNIQVEALVTHAYPLNALPAALEDYLAGKALKVFIAL